MLAALMYHRVGTGKHANSLELLKAHLAHLKGKYPIVLPGDPLTLKKLSVCLTFDDASFDFYHYIFPLLKELNLKALLAVCPSYILPTTSLDPSIRLSVPYTLAMQEGIFQQKAPFCTYEELSIMAQSGHVEIACHSATHPNLTFKHLDLKSEIVSSKHLLEENLPQAITSFVYPFGRTSESVQRFVNKHYAYAFRIGSALNFSWSPLISRFPADNLPHPTAPLTPLKLLKGGLKRLIL